MFGRVWFASLEFFTLNFVVAPKQRHFVLQSENWEISHSLLICVYLGISDVLPSSIVVLCKGVVLLHG